MKTANTETHYEARPTKDGVIRWSDISHSERTFEDIKNYVEKHPSEFEGWGWTIVEVTTTYKII